MNQEIKDLLYPLEWTARFFVIVLLAEMINKPAIGYMAISGVWISFIVGIWDILKYYKK